MDKRIASFMAGAAIVGSGLAGFGLTSAFAQTDDSTPSTEEAPATEEAPPADAPADGEGCPGGPRGAGLSAMAEAIGISEDELRTALEDGSTPAEVAEENGVSRDDLVAAIVADIEEHLAQAVEDGHLTQEEADEKAADAEERANDIVDGIRPEGMGPGGPGGPPAADGEESQDSEADAQESSFSLSF